MVVITLVSGATYTASLEDVKVYPAGDIEYKNALHGSIMGRIYGRNKRGIIKADYIKSTAFY